MAGIEQPRADRQRTLERTSDDGTVTDADYPAVNLAVLPRCRDLELAAEISPGLTVP